MKDVFFPAYDMKVVLGDLYAQHFLGTIGSLHDESAAKTSKKKKKKNAETPFSSSTLRCNLIRIDLNKTCALIGLFSLLPSFNQHIIQVSISN
uniref:Uncharacterized protein n=1 Tax=Megaselia scalaris TaxID=36166 RepID=T1GR50_MEGSC